MNLSLIIEMAPLFVAPIVLVIFTLVTAYVLKFGLAGTGINFDYMLFCLVTILALVFGGAI